MTNQNQCRYAIVARLSAEAVAELKHEFGIDAKRIYVDVCPMLPDGVVEAEVRSLEKHLCEMTTKETTRQIVGPQPIPL